jgi:hypothetical protein
MKPSLDTVGYGGCFTAPGKTLSLEDGFRRAAKFGNDAVCIYAHRPLGFPFDLAKDTGSDPRSADPPGDHGQQRGDAGID